MGLEAVTYIGYMLDYADLAKREMSSIASICNADTSHHPIESIFRQNTTLEFVERTYKERIAPYELIVV